MSNVWPWSINVKQLQIQSFVRARLCKDQLWGAGLCQFYMAFGMGFNMEFGVESTQAEFGLLQATTQNREISKNVDPQIPEQNRCFAKTIKLSYSNFKPIIILSILYDAD